MSDTVPPAAVALKSNPKRAAVLAQEAEAASLQGQTAVSQWLHDRAIAYLVGQRG